MKGLKRLILITVLLLWIVTGSFRSIYSEFTGDKSEQWGLYPGNNS